MHGNLLYTHAGNDRFFGPEHDLANIQLLWTSFGLTTTLHAFTAYGGTYYNVVGELPGTMPNDISALSGPTTIRSPTRAWCRR